jgi:hypothetical protein
VKSRITRGRNALRKKLAGFVREVGPELGLLIPAAVPANVPGNTRRQSATTGSGGDRELEVTL